MIEQSRRRRREEHLVPKWLAVIGAWGWRFVGTAAAVLVIVRVLGYFDVAGTRDSHHVLGRCGRRTLLGLWIVPRFSDQISTVGTAVSDGADRIEGWFIDGPFGLSRDQANQHRDDLGTQLTSGRQGVTSQIMRSRRTAVGLTIGFVVTLVLTFFVVKGGRQVIDRFLRRVDPKRERRLRPLSDGLWDALGGYSSGTAANGVVSAFRPGERTFAARRSAGAPRGRADPPRRVRPALVGAFPVGGAAALRRSPPTAWGPRSQSSASRSRSTTSRETSRARSSWGDPSTCRLLPAVPTVACGLSFRVWAGRIRSRRVQNQAVLDRRVDARRPGIRRISEGADRGRTHLQTSSVSSGQLEPQRGAGIHRIRGGPVG